MLTRELMQQTLTEQEPAFYGFMMEEECCVHICYSPAGPGGPNNELPTAYYTSPPQRQPLVSIEMLLDWKSQVNEIAARTNKAERYRAGAALKQSIADVIADHGIGDNT
jgi:hypothetical protein